jgi:subtilisin family serine protease
MKKVLLSFFFLCFLNPGFTKKYTSSEVESFLTTSYVNWGLTQESVSPKALKKLKEKFTQQPKELKRAQNPALTKSLNKNIDNSIKQPKKLNPSISLREALKIFNQSNRPVTVAVIDTGIALSAATTKKGEANNFFHPHFKNNIYADLTTKADSKNFGKDFSQSHLGKITNTPVDLHGHGTHVSGIIKSIFPDVRIIPIKYYNANATGEQNLVNSIQALEYAVELGVDIINYSGGGPEADFKNKLKELAIVKKAQKKGVLIIAASGNNGSNIDLDEHKYYPASYNLDNILTVGSYDQDLKILDSSNKGVGTVHVVAPGSKIQSAYIKDGGGRMTGTSQATAFVSGIAALLKSAYPELNFLEIKNIIHASSEYEELYQGKILGGKADAYNALIQANTLANAKRVAAKENKSKDIKRKTANTKDVKNKKK